MIKQIVLAISLVFSPMFNALAVEEHDTEIHQELRGLLKQIETAINSGNYDAMLPLLSENLRITPINQEFLSSRQEVSAYFQKWFGVNGRLKKLEISFEPDALTELSSDKTWGLVWGKGVEDYILSDARKFELHTRWTAVVVKEDDGRWRIRSIHVGTNFLDNPVLSVAENSVKYFAAGGIAIGLLAGFLLARLFHRRNK
ncbi:MAG: nuclear transport factor 2 family protein [Mariprofundaceae bacterium]